MKTRIIFTNRGVRFLAFSSDKFPPILVGELSLKIIRKTLATKLGFRPSLSKKELDDILKKIESSFMVMKYSYLQQNELVSHEEIVNIEKLSLMLEDAFNPGKMTPSTVKISLLTLNWGVNIFRGLMRRMKVANEELGSGIDFKVLRVRNVQKQGEFLLTRAYDQLQAYTVMTNLLTLRPNTNLAVAMLPPQEVGGTLSEGMYLGDEEREEEAGQFLNPNLLKITEVNAILHQLIHR